MLHIAHLIQNRATGKPLPLVLKTLLAGSVTLLLAGLWLNY